MLFGGLIAWVYSLGVRLEGNLMGVGEFDGCTLPPSGAVNLGAICSTYIFSLDNPLTIRLLNKATCSSGQLDRRIGAHTERGIDGNIPGIQIWGVGIYWVYTTIPVYTTKYRVYTLLSLCTLFSWPTGPWPKLGASPLHS